MDMRFYPDHDLNEELLDEFKKILKTIVEIKSYCREQSENMESGNTSDLHGILCLRRIEKIILREYKYQEDLNGI